MRIAYCVSDISSIISGGRVPDIGAMTLRTFVYQARSGRVGFDVDELSRSVVDGFSNDAWSVPTSSGEIVSLSDNGPAVELIRRELFPKRVMIAGPDEVLRGEIRLLGEYRRKEKQQVLRSRYQKPTVSLKVPRLAEWSDDDGIPAGLVSLIAQHSTGLLLWRFGSFGLYFQVIDVESRFVDLATAVASQNKVNIVAVESASQLPQW